MKITKESHPALWFVLYGTDLGAWSWMGDGVPGTCEMCPFGKLTVPYHEVANDPSEAYYNCRLLRTQVWGEDPKCQEENWKKQARQELGLEKPEWPAKLSTTT